MRKAGLRTVDVSDGRVVLGLEGLVSIKRHRWEQWTYIEGNVDDLSLFASHEFFAAFDEVGKCWHAVNADVDFV